jgi:protein TonB
MRSRVARSRNRPHAANELRHTVGLIDAREHGGEEGISVARSNEMAEDAPDPLPDIGEIRPTRTDQGAAGDGTTVTRLLGSTDPTFAPGRPAPNRAAFTASGAVAATAHALVLLALISVPPRLSGSGGDSTDSISVSIISAAALESKEPSTNAAAGATPEKVAPKEGDSETVSQASPDKPEETVQTPKPEATETPAVEAEKEVAAAPTAPEAPAPETLPDAQAAPIIAAPPEPVREPKVAMVDPPPEPPPPEKREEKPKEEKPKDKASPPSPEEATAGGAQSRGIAPDLPPASAAASASSGDVRAYGLAIQEALLAVDLREAQARSTAARVRGKVLVGLMLSADGAVERADIQRSSGHRALDEAAIQLVRLTAFPRPPAGLTANQRYYWVPIVFK